MIKNIFNQFVYQFGNYILPLLIIPFMVNNLDSYLYTKIIVIQSVILILAVFINYGMDLHSTRFVSKTIDEEELSDYLAVAMTFKFVLSSFIIFIFVFFSFCIFDLNNYVVFYASFWILSYSFQCNWFFQGKDRFNIITLCGVIPKIIILPLVFYFVNNETYYNFFVINATSVFLSNIIMFYIMSKNVNFITNLKYVNVSKIKEFIFLGSPIFLSQASTTLINNFNSIFLPSVLEPKVFIIYNTSERVIRVISILSTPITNVIFPKIARQAANKEKVFSFINKMLLLIIFLFFILYFIFYMFGYDILDIIFPKISHDLFFILKWTLFIPLMVFINNLWGTQIGLNYSKDKEFTTVIFIGGILNVFFICFFGIILKLPGVILAVLITQMLILFGMYRISRSCGYEFKIK